MLTLMVLPLFGNIIAMHSECIVDDKLKKEFNSSCCNRDRYKEAISKRKSMNLPSVKSFTSSLPFRMRLRLITENLTMAEETANHANSNEITHEKLSIEQRPGMTKVSALTLSSLGHSTRVKRQRRTIKTRTRMARSYCLRCKDPACAKAATIGTSFGNVGSTAGKAGSPEWRYVQSQAGQSSLHERLCQYAEVWELGTVDRDVCRLFVTLQINNKVVIV